MKEFIIRFKDSKLWSFILKYHLLYLALPFCFWGVKALLYNIVIWINPPTRVLHFSIDESIPFIKYFLYFILPIIFFLNLLYGDYLFTIKRSIGQYWGL